MNQSFEGHDSRIINRVYKTLGKSAIYYAKSFAYLIIIWHSFVFNYPCYRATWHSPEGRRDVAIKYFETEHEKAEFQVNKYIAH